MLTGERAAVPIPPPPETEWYHGRLDRYSAEQRLKAAYKLGSYLGETRENICSSFSLILSFSSLTNANAVRESDRKPGSYVLSYLGGKTGINHFR